MNGPGAPGAIFIFGMNKLRSFVRTERVESDRQQGN
jgi:hypothetical protein